MSIRPQVHSHARSVGGVLALAATTWMASSLAQAQTVYRCEHQGHVTYSHEPCLGAKVVDTTPTRGLDKWTGVSRKGEDARREDFNRGMSEAIRPITGMTHEQRMVFQRRMKLPADAQYECKLLDARISQQERAVRDSSPKALAEAETQLFLSRSRFRDLRC